MRSIMFDQALQDLAGIKFIDAASHRTLARLAAAAGNLCASSSNCAGCIVQCRNEIPLARSERTI